MCECPNVMINPNTFFGCSNRCAALLKLQKAGKALTDAETCIRLKPEWEKGHYRKAMVLEAMGDLEQVEL